MVPKIKISMFLFGLILWASLLSFVEALPTDMNPVKRVRWGVNKDRIYRLPEGMAPRGVYVAQSNPSAGASETGCKCGGTCEHCRQKKMMRDDSAEERLFGFGSQSYNNYGGGYGSSMGYDPYYSSSSYDPYYSQPYYEPYGSYGSYGHDPYYGSQYPSYW